MRILFLVTFLLFTLEAKSFFSNSDQADNSVYIGSLKDLIIATQKTRGLTNSYMNGNTAALLLVYDNRNTMKSAIGVMESLPLAADPVVNARSSEISKALIKLNNKALKYKADETFSNYTEQIAQILMLAQTVSKRFAEDLNPFAREASSMMMEVMLPMTEYTGQMRGFGSGLAAKQQRTESELSKIHVLSSEINRLNQSLQKRVIDLKSKYPKKLPLTIDGELKKLDLITLEYIAFAQVKFDNDITNIDPNSYFDNGTKIISQIIKIYNIYNDAILEDSKGWI
jgi:hypothetical protein